MNEETYHTHDFDCDYCGIETMVEYTGVYSFGILPRGWSKDYNKTSCMSGQCHEDHQDYIEETEGDSQGGDQ